MSGDRVAFREGLRRLSAKLTVELNDRTRAVVADDQVHAKVGQYAVLFVHGVMPFKYEITKVAPKKLTAVMHVWDAHNTHLSFPSFDVEGDEEALTATFRLRKNGTWWGGHPGPHRLVLLA